MSPQKLLPYFLFCLALLVLGYFAVQRTWDADRYYAKEWQVKHDEQVKRQAKIDRLLKHRTPSKQPKPPGASESDIKKYRGKRYSTY